MKVDHSYATGIMTGAIVGFLLTQMSYTILASVSQGTPISTWSVMTIFAAAIVGVLVAYVFGQLEHHTKQ